LSDEAIAGDEWVIEGLGRKDSIPARLKRATEIILVDLPLWIHFWLAAERQMAWAKGPIDHPPGVAIRDQPVLAIDKVRYVATLPWVAASNTSATVRSKAALTLQAFCK
jgi:hypothetical protein